MCMCTRIYHRDNGAGGASEDERDLMFLLDLKRCSSRLLCFKMLRFSVCRKEQSILSPVNCWNLLLLQVKRESRDHATLSDLYLNNIIPRFAQVSEDSGRLFKKVKHWHSKTGASLNLCFWFFRCVLKGRKGSVPAPQVPSASSQAASYHISAQDSFFRICFRQ